MIHGLTSSNEVGLPGAASSPSIRLQRLRKLKILDTPPDAALDEVTQTIADYFEVPISLISILDAERQWFKSKVGLSISETPLNVSFCIHTIQTTDVFVVEDALKDERFKLNPLVIGEPGIRFYAGAPLLSAGGVQIGALCIIDRRPRCFSAADAQRLSHFASITSALIEDLYENCKIAERLSRLQILPVPLR